MARYYEEETLFQSVTDELLKYFSDSFVCASDELFHKVLANTPTADVVPKSEVERLKEELEMVKLEYAGFEAGVKHCIKTYKNKVAREIFEEIEQETARVYNDFLFNREGVGMAGTLFVVDFSDEIDLAIAELKKKYTEVRNDT